MRMALPDFEFSAASISFWSGLVFYLVYTAWILGTVCTNDGDREPSLFYM